MTVKTANMSSYTNTLQSIADKASIGLSVLCALHCLALPLVVVLLPSLVALGLEDESFHLWLVIVVIPVSAYALVMGCSKHRRMGVLYIGLLGMGILCLAPFVGHEFLGEFGEKLLTLAGAVIIAATHVRNFRLCRQSTSCNCAESG